MNKGVIVTGGGHGIGKQICLDFLSSGYKVCFIDIDEKNSKNLKASMKIYFITMVM